MPYQNLPGLDRDVDMISNEGNAVVIRRKIKEAIAVGDGVRAIRIPKGFVIDRIRVVCSGTNVNALTMKVGYDKTLRGGDGAVDADDDYFIPATDLDSPGQINSDAVPPYIVRDDVFVLTAVVDGAAATAATDFDVIVTGEYLVDVAPFPQGVEA